MPPHDRPPASPPTYPTADRAFARFRATRDPDELAELFRETADPLRRAARLLVTDSHTVDDLIQTTFLTAIDEAASFDSGRPVLPWLLGILANRARRARHLAQLRPDPERLPGSAIDQDPLTIAAARDFADVILRAIDQVPSAYQAVLDLHLGKGLNAAEIAGSLGRRRSTVRVQLVRGLSYLRRALPAPR